MSENGHFIRLHTHSHPTNISSLSIKSQKEYRLNKRILEKIIKKNNNQFSSCGKYNFSTLKILREMGIMLSFNAKLKIDNKNQSLTI